MSQLLPILVVSLLAWYWWAGNQAREVAVSAAVLACKQIKVQFLDQTVVLAQVRLRRDAGGRLRVQRTYVFEFSEQGDERSQGFAVMLGRYLANMQLNVQRLDEPPKVH